jgi:integral membrane protein
MKGYSRQTFELTAILEGVSFLLLLGVAMPLKYFADMPLPTRVCGLLHGFAFLAYVTIVIDALATKQWSTRTVALGFAAGFLPFGTFAFVNHLRRQPAGPAPR